MPLQTPQNSKLNLLSQTLRQIVHGDEYGPYRCNIFRILGMPTDIDPAEARRRERMRELREAKSTSPANAGGFPLALDPPPDKKQRKDALDCLMTRPLEQLIHELFWFWPTEEDDGRAISCAKFDDAVKHWSATIARSDAGPCSSQHAPVAGGAAAHNLAVYYHTRALDTFCRPDLPGARYSEAGDLMDKALRCWHTALRGAAVREHLLRRAAELPDPNLTNEVVLRLIESVPEGILQISSGLAAALLARGKRAEAEDQITRLRASAFSEAQIDAAVKSAVSAAANEIKRLSQSAEAQANAEPVHAGALIRRLHGQLSGHLAVIDLLLPRGDSTRSGLHDVAADVLLQCNQAFAGKTEDWIEAVALAELAGQLAAGASQRGTMRKHIEVMKRNAASGLDWCSPRYWDLPTATLDKLEAIREDRKKRRWDLAINALTELILAQDDDVPDEARKILNHCMAICLCLKSVDQYNAGLAEVGKNKDVVEQLWDNLDAMTENQRDQVLSTRPDPTKVSGRSACPVCGDTLYTAWKTFPYRDLQAWVCGGCNTRYATQRAKRKELIGKVAKECAACSILACDFDTTDPGIIRSLEDLRAVIQESGGSLPSVEEAARSARLVVSPPSLANSRSRKQEKARRDLEEARQIFEQIGATCESGRQTSYGTQQAGELARRLAASVNRLARLGQAAHPMLERSREDAADTLLSVDLAVQWPTAAIMERAQLLETAQEIAAGTPARDRVSSVLTNVSAKAARWQRILRQKSAVAAP
ncbi:MAG: hypothetical protein ABSB42_10270 [Tepidisphaeraceae bacterium]